MKKIVTRALAVAIAFTTMVSMSGIMTVNAEAAAKKSNVEVVMTGKTNKKASVKSISATVDGATKAKQNVTVYLTGNKKVKIHTQVKVTVKNQKMNKKFKKNIGKVTYSSNNKSVATVNSKGVITAKKAGKAVITIKSKANSKKTYKIKLTVKKGVKSMKLNTDSTATLKPGETKSFTPTVKTVKGVSKAIKASTSDKKVATVSVSKKGEVTITAVAAGEAEIAVAPKKGSAKAQVIKVTVEDWKYRTKVEFADTKAKEVTLKGTLSWKDQKDLSKAVAEFAKVVGGTYTLEVNGKTAEVVNGVVSEADLAKIPVSGEKKDVTIKSSLTIEDALKLAGAVKADAKVAFNGSFAIGGATVSDISLANKEVTFKFGTMDLKAYVIDGNLYLDGDQSKLLELYKTIYDSNKEVVKGFTVEMN